MAPDIRQQAETGQTIAATPAAPLIVASTPPRQHTQRHSIQNYYIPKWRLTFRVKLNVIATTSSTTLFARTHIYTHRSLHLSGQTKEICDPQNWSRRQQSFTSGLKPH